jgi:hypothetical protein
MLFLIILLLSFISSYFLPWWFVAVIAFLAAFFMGKSAVRPFLSGFAAVFVAWAVLALFKTLPNDNLLAKKVAVLFPLGGNWILLLLITAIIGGLVGGMSALSGALLKKAFDKK